MKTLAALVGALIVGTVVFWVVRFGAWMEALQTVKTPFFWAMTRVMAWGFAALFGALAFWQFREKP